jgi:hypothetical protein
MRHPLLIGLLAVGTVLGFGSAIFHRAHGARHEAFERHVADICAESALRAAGKSGVSAAPR